MFLLIVFLPLLSFLQLSLFGYYFGKKGSSLLSILYIFCSWLLSLNLLYISLGQDFLSLTVLSKWFHFHLFYIDWSFCLNNITIIMFFVVLTISLLVHIYSYEYMNSDPHLIRFMSYLSFFTFFMLILVSGNNLLQLFMGWEGVGLCSYLLINFWFTRIQANKAAIKAMIYNRIGDFGLVIGLMLLFKLFYSLNYGTIFNLVYYYSNINFMLFSISINALELICFCLFIGSMGKSAQLGLHAWLPDAMEGPTPVSALIHAATMVTAGVFLLVKMSIVFECTNFVLTFISVIGAITAFFAATVGLVQNDLKKVIAYSTCSQLGYMILICGLSNYNLGMFHLFNHAFFKALLFLTAGAIIHSVQDEQDIRRLGGLKKLLPLSYVGIVIGSMALIGFPFLAGFYSKDIILEFLYSSYTQIGHFTYVLGILAACGTTFYSFRLLYLVFLTKPAGYKKVYLQIHESDIYISFSLIILSLFSIFVGFIFKDIFLGLGQWFWLNSINYNTKTFLFFNYEFISSSIKLIPLIFLILITSISYIFYVNNSRLIYNFKLGLKTVYTYLNKKWFFDKLVTYNFSWVSLNLSLQSMYFLVDRGLIEMVGGTNIYKISKRISSNTGLVLNSPSLYHLLLVIGLVLISVVILYLI